MTGRAGHFATRVSACTAEVKISDGSTVMRPSGEGPLVEHLARYHIEMTDIPVREGDPAVDIERRKQRPVHDDVAEIGCIKGEGVNEMLPDLLPPVIPCPSRRRTGA